MVDHAPVALDGFGKLVDASARMVHFSGRFAAGFNQAASYYYGAGNADNQALRPAVAHLLAGRLPAAWAGPVCQAFAIVAVAIFGWFTRRPYGGSLGPAWLREASALLILATLLAPIARVQHLVLTIPAIYLIVSGWLAEHASASARELRRWPLSCSRWCLTVKCWARDAISS
jgi:hypothetical protein